MGYVVEDITADREAESALRLTQLSVDQASDLIHWIAADGRLLYASESSCRRHGYSREELLGMTIFDLDPLLTPTDWGRLWDEIRVLGTTSFDTTHRTKSGEMFPIEVVGNYVCHDGCEYNFVYGRDISDRKLAEEQLRVAKSSLETSNRELEAAVRLAEEAAKRLREMNERLLRTQEALALQARTDSLTGCLNRGALFESLRKELARADREGGKIGIGMIDIDHFKRINDTHGHQAGDNILAEVVRRAQEALRPYDIFGRFGGEEFLAVLPGPDEDELGAALERVRTRICERPITALGHDIAVTVSIGGAWRGGESVDALVGRADAALYSAKAAGRNRLVLA
jgi:diguanylate cyclase (GGDEF)-like protein/PAS domain S-box-containing protein